MAFESSARRAPEAYFGATDVMRSVEQALNACYAAQPSNPVRFVAEHLRSACQIPLIESGFCQTRLDASGSPVVEVVVELVDGSAGVVGSRIAVSPQHPSSVRCTLSAPSNRRQLTAHASEAIKGLVGLSAADLSACFAAIRNGDGTEAYATLGTAVAAAASLSVVLACARFSRCEPFAHLAAAMRTPKSRYVLPLPVVSLLGAGEQRAFGKVRICDVCFVPGPASSVVDSMTHASRLIEELAHKLGDEATQINADGTLRMPTAIDTVQGIVDLVEDGMKEVGLLPGQDAFVGLVIDAAWCFKAESKRYFISDGTGELSGAQLAEHLATLCRERRSIAYIEDALHPSDRLEMRRLMSRVGTTVAVCAAQSTGSNCETAAALVSDRAANTVGARIEDCGTLDLTASVLTASRGISGVVGAVISTQLSTPFVADAAVAFGSQYFRAGGILRGNGPAAYNRLCDVESLLTKQGCLVDRQLKCHETCVVPDPPAEVAAEIPTKNDKKRK